MTLQRNTTTGYSLLAIVGTTSGAHAAGSNWIDAMSLSYR